MNVTEVISLIASIASLVLAVIAIWLSIVFFKLSSKLSESTTEAAKGIGASVDRLEKLFDKLYSDTFSMMKDTVSDMRRHIWPDQAAEYDRLGEEAERKADAKIEDLKQAITAELSNVLQRQKVADERLESFSSDMSRLIDRIITTSRQVDVEARTETLRAAITRTLRLLLRRRGRVTASELVERLAEEAPASRIIHELSKLAEDGIVVLSESTITPETTIAFRSLNTRNSNLIEHEPSAP